MKHKKLSTKWQIYFYMMLFSGTMIVLLWVFQVLYLDTFYKTIKKTEAKRVYAQLTNLIERKDPKLESKIQKIAGEHNYSVMLTNESLTYLYYANFNPTSSLLNMPHSMFQQLLSEAKENNGEYSITFIGSDNVTLKNEEFDLQDGSEQDGINDGDDSEGKKKFYQNLGEARGESVIYLRIIDEDAYDPQILLVNTTMTPVTSTVETIKIQLLVITILMLVLAMLFAFLISNMIARPMIRMNQAAKKLAKGDFAPNFREDKYRELAELSDTLNYAAAELGKTEQFQHELIANVSHDLRTPLTMITGYAEVMRDIPGENTPENVQVIIDEANRLTTLVNDVLDLSKLQGGVQTIDKCRYNLTESIRQVFRRYNKLREQEGYLISFEEEREVYVEADEYKIYQVVYNLINNAINYCGEDKTVVVRQTVLDGKVRIEITDSGVGIPPEELDNVWERYYKVDKNHRRSVQGTGLGLSIVKNILKLHHANYGVESVVGEGSTFWFELDVAEE
ncbi:Signal transduction histidine kinase [Lachnospiraceae bacterium XBB1006]|nr:Signal transduction histidine kinase [Lachnospiraceae bacterium XBB1006]